MSAAAAVLAASVAWAAAAGCTHRVERRTVPAFSAALGAKAPPTETLPDGTVVIYDTSRPGSGLKPPSPDAKPLRTREEHEDGSITLRAWLPQDVLANFLACLRNEEYELFWDQMVAAATKREYERQGRGDGREEFVDFCRRHRRELAATLSRMMLGFSRSETLLEDVGGGVIRVRLYPHVAGGHQFTQADIVRERDGMRLLVMR